MKFTECIDIVGERPKQFDGQRKYVSTGAVDTDHIDENSVEFVDYESRPSRADLTAKTGDVLFAKMAATKKALLLDNDTSKYIYSTGFFAIRAKKEVIKPECLLLLINSDLFLAQKDKNASGATQKSITNKGLETIEISVPPIHEQNVLVEKLKSVSAIILARKQQLSALDTLNKARFVEMFGTFPINEKGWKTGAIREVISEARYGSSRPAVDGGQYPYLRMNNITYGGELDLTDTKRIDVPVNELPKCSVSRGDVLFNRTNSKELVGKTCVYNRDEMMVLAGFVIRVRVNDLVVPEFLSAFLNTDFSKQMLLGMCKAAIGQANINAQEMQNIGIYIPPIECQKDFSVFKTQVDKSKVVVQKALDEAQLLFDSLMQQYFG